MTCVEFGDRREPYSIARGKVRRWLHAIVRDVDTLPALWAAQAREFLAGHDVDPSQAQSLLVTYDEQRRYRVSYRGGAFDVDFGDLPAWLREEQPEPAKPARAKAKAS